MGAIYSMDKFMGGAMAEKFSEAMDDVAANVLDPNTKADAVRKINIELTINPNKERDIAAITVEVKKRLAGHKPIESRVAFDRDLEGRAVCGEFGSGANSNQVELMVGEDGATGLDTKDEFKGLKVVK